MEIFICNTHKKNDMTLIEKINEISEIYQNSFGETLESVPDWFISDILNIKPQTTVSQYKPIPTKDLKSILIVSGEFAKIKQISETGSDPSKSLCINVIETLNSFETINLNVVEYYDSYQTMKTELFYLEIISESTKDKFTSLITTEDVIVYGLSWAEENDLYIDSRSVGLARGGKP